LFKNDSPVRIVLGKCGKISTVDIRLQYVPILFKNDSPVRIVLGKCGKISTVDIPKTAVVSNF